MNGAISFELSFVGHDADLHQIDLYDVAQAMVGFQRSIALTSHLVINGKIIVQAPALKGARVLALPAEDGSWKTTAVVLAGVYAIGTAPVDTPLGHLVHSMYDYVVSETLGEHVDYDKSIGQIYEQYKEQNIEVPKIEQHQADSLLEKCETAIKEIHRPIHMTQSASEASITSVLGETKLQVGTTFSLDTYEFIHEVIASDFPEIIQGRITSYNSNTFKGRIYVAKEGRPVSFELTENARGNNAVQLLVASLSVNAIKDYNSEWSQVYCRVIKYTSKSGHLKKFTILQVSHTEIN